MIRYYRHSEIDNRRWDECISQSGNALPYALSWWLDAVCPEWDALIGDDYLAVMPLTHGRKMGIHYLYQPYFTQQLGVFSKSDPVKETVREFIDAIPDKYKYVQVQFNTANLLQQLNLASSSRKSYLLDLAPAAIELSSNYHRNCRRNIQKAIHEGLDVKPGPGPALFTRFINQNLEKQLSGSMKVFSPILLRIINASLQQQVGEIAGVYSRGGELLAAAWFVTANGRCLFLVCASTDQGKEKQAMYLLVDHMIRKNAGTGLTFDFAGSDIPGIAYFNAGFGAKETYYGVYRRNNLPWPLKMLKK
jgi:hypothetical protein